MVDKKAGISSAPTEAEGNAHGTRGQVCFALIAFMAASGVLCTASEENLKRRNIDPTTQKNTNQ